MVDVDERGFGKLPQRVRRDHDDLPAQCTLDPHAVALELAVGGPVLAEREQRRVAIGWRQLDVHGFRPVRMRGEARGRGRVLGAFAWPVTSAVGRDDAPTVVRGCRAAAPSAGLVAALRFCQYCWLWKCRGRYFPFLFPSPEVRSDSEDTT